MLGLKEKSMGLLFVFICFLFEAVLYCGNLTQNAVFFSMKLVGHSKSISVKYSATCFLRELLQRYV